MVKPKAPTCMFPIDYSAMNATEEDMEPFRYILKYVIVLGLDVDNYCASYIQLENIDIFLLRFTNLFCPAICEHKKPSKCPISAPGVYLSNLLTLKRAVSTFYRDSGAGHSRAPP